MISRRRHDLVFAIYPQSRGFAFVLFEGWLAPVDWGVYEARGADKNARWLSRIASLLVLHTPDVLILQNMSEGGTHRAPRIQELNRRAAELADQRGILVRSYSRTQVVDGMMMPPGSFLFGIDTLDDNAVVERAKFH